MIKEDAGKHVKRGIDKKGRLYTRMVNNEKPTVNKVATSIDKKPVKEAKPEEWWGEYKKYNLSKYPIGIPQDKVKVNLDGDINSHSILKWNDPKTGKQIDAYTKEFFDRNAEKKWSKMKNIDSKIIESILKKSDVALHSEDKKLRQCGAIIKIIASTGLRVGSRTHFKQTKNRGVSTLAPSNIKIDGDTVSFSFTGKSYKENTSEIKDAKLAEVLKEQKNLSVKDGNEFLFDYDRVAVDKVFKDNFGFKGMNLKDMRTYMATSVAKNILFEEQDFAKKLTQNDKQNKKIITDKLNDCYKRVSEVLNNTPTMARKSYIHPNVVKDWLVGIGANVEEFMKSMNIESMLLENPDLNTLISKYPASGSEAIDDTDEEYCDVFNKFSWEE